MPKFIPLDKDGQQIDELKVSAELLQDLYITMVCALDNNPSTKRFENDIESMKSHFSDPEKFDKWLEYLKTIKTMDETDDHINFMLEDWIDTWYISDFIDQQFKIANIIF